MKKSLLLNCGFAFLLSTGLCAAENKKDEWQKNSSGSHYSYEQSEFTTFQYNATEGELNGYTLNPGGAPDGYSYVAEKTVASAGGLNVSDETKEDTGSGGVKKLKLNGAASATAWIAANASPVSFTISMSGELTKSGDGGGPVTWSASADTKFFYIKNNKTSDSKDAIVLVGDGITYTAYERSSAKSSNWIVKRGSSPIEKAGSTNFILPDHASHVSSWLIPGTSAVREGRYDFEAKNPDNNKTDSGITNVVGPAAISLKPTGSTGTTVSGYGKAVADGRGELVLWGDPPINSRTQALSVTVTLGSAVSYDQIPSGWQGVSAINLGSTSLSSLLVADGSQPKLKAQIIPNTMGSIGYVYAGGNGEAYQKFVKFVKFGILAIPTTDRFDLYVFKSKTGHEFVDFTAAVNPPVLESEIDPEKPFVWEIVKGADKVELIFKSDDTRKKNCRVKARGITNLSQASDDVEVKVSWSYGGIGAEKTIKFTVRSVAFMQVVSNTRPQNFQWLVVYRIYDQLREALSDEICRNLVASESFEKQVWIGWGNHTSPILQSNRLTDTFEPPPPARSTPGDGRQTITIDRMKRTHNISIPVNSPNVIYSDITYQYE